MGKPTIIRTDETPLANAWTRRHVAKALKDQVIELRDHYRRGTPDVVAFADEHNINFDELINHYKEAQQRWEIKIGELTGEPPPVVIDLQSAGIIGRSHLEVGGG